jgi:predicted nuclease of predicted toxin-antitoxin system
VRWLADECIAATLVAYLRADGHDVLYVAEAAAGLSDADVVALASREIRLLLTEDKDFDDLVFRRERVIIGVVLMRINPENPALKATVSGGHRAIWRNAFQPICGDRGGAFPVSSFVGVR